MPSSRREALGKGLGLRVMIFILSYIYYALWKQHSSYRDEPNGAVIERFRAEPGQRVQKDTISIQIVAQMDELFGIDGQARQEGLSQIEHHVLRLDKSKPLLEQIKAAIQAARTGACTPNDFSSLQELEQRLLAFQSHYERSASPLQLTFTRHDLHALLVKIATKRLASAA